MAEQANPRAWWPGGRTVDGILCMGGLLMDFQLGSDVRFRSSHGLCLPFLRCR